MSRTRHTDQEKARILREFTHHDGSAASFCRQRGISYQTLMNWRGHASANLPDPEHPPAFLEFQLESAQHRPAPFGPLVELELGGGIILRIIAQLYMIEKPVREYKVDAAVRLRIRKNRSRPLIALLGKAFKHLITTRIRPKSGLGQALQYALGQWPAMQTFLEDGLVEIDNNDTENDIRPSAVGKKNWLFVGSPEAGKRSAVMCTLLISARKSPETGHPRHLRSENRAHSNGGRSGAYDWVSDKNVSRDTQQPVTGAQGGAERVRPCGWRVDRRTSGLFIGISSTRRTRFAAPDGD